MNKPTEETKKDEAFYSALIENVRDMIFLSDENLHIIYCSPSAESITGFSTEEILKDGSAGQTHPDDIEKLMSVLVEILNNPDKPFPISFRMRHKEGRDILLEGMMINKLNDKNVRGIVSNLSDISERTQCEQDLRNIIGDASDYKYALEESSIVAIADENGVIKYANHNFSKISKYSLHELIGQSNLIIHPEFHTDEFIKNLWNTLAKGQIWRGELKNKAKDGSDYWVDTSIVPFLNEQGKPYQFVIIRTDITERKLAEEELQVSRDRLLFHFENMPLGFFEYDNQLHVTTMSKKAEQIFGWRLNEFKEHPETAFNTVYKEDLPWVSNVAQQLMSGEVERNKVVHRSTTKHGKIIWCEWFNSVLKDTDGKVVTILSLVQDITERKQGEQNLLRSEARLKEAQALSHISNWEIDLLTNECTWSDELYNIFGIKREDIQPSREAFLTLLHPDDIVYAKSIIEKAFKTHEGSSIYARMRTKDGSKKFVYSECRFEFDNNKKPIRFFGTVQDLTERKIAEKVHEKMTADLLQRNNDLEQFAYIVSHNLRAPVANIIGLSTTAQIENLDPDMKKEVMEGLSHSVKKLDEVILDLNQILEVKLEVNEKKEMVDFSQLANDVHSSIENLIEKEQAVLIWDFSEVTGMMTLKSYLYSIFYNLISNSIKYRQLNTSPVIEIKSSMLKGKIELIFKDNGRGIDLKKNGHQVFGLYKRFHPEVVDGTGKGLYMVKTQVETLGGKITISSEVNKGTEFKIEFAT